MSLNILIVDDSAMMRAMIKRVTALCDIPIDHIYEAANGAEAIKVLESHDVQALFTDINMPVMTGTELLRAIASRRRAGRTCCGSSSPPTGPKPAGTKSPS